VLDASFVYWTTAATVMRAPLAGGSSVELASGQNSPIGLAIDAGSLYWMNTNGSLMRVTK
jgi:sugar lactone lactonase YvrE